MFDFKIEHLLLFVIAIFLLYHLLGGCGCYNGVIEGFSVGGGSCNINCCGSTCATRITMTNMCNTLNTLNNKIDNLTFIYNTITGELQDIKGALGLPPESITN